MLGNYNFNIHYRSGITNADTLSHIQCPTIISDPDMVDLDETIGTQSIKAICNNSRISFANVKPYVVEQLVCQASLLTCLLVLHSPLIG